MISNNDRAGSGPLLVRSQPCGFPEIPKPPVVTERRRPSARPFSHPPRCRGRPHPCEKKRIYYSSPVKPGMLSRTEPICGAVATNGAVCQITHGLNQSGRCRLHAGPERMCGALTMNGTLCRNPNTGTLGLCPAHSSIASEAPRRECGAPTGKGTRCTITYLTAFGRCAYHTRTMRYSDVRASSKRRGWSVPKHKHSRRSLDSPPRNRPSLRRHPRVNAARRLARALPAVSLISLL